MMQNDFEAGPETITFMQQALEGAATRRGFCAPNPAVGAVVVKEGRVIGQGVHWACGFPHAEVEALTGLDPQEVAGATLLVTLEPCCHQGKTPPCIDLIKKCRIKEVIYGMVDPNPEMAGQGAYLLSQAGISCRRLKLPAIETFYQSYCHWWKTNRPFVTAKLAISLDGKIAGPEGQPVTLTGEACARLTHQRRKQSDAILTTANTIIADNPRLDVRLDDTTIRKSIYVLDSNLRLPIDAQVLKTSNQLTVFHREEIDMTKLQQLQDKNVRCVPISYDAMGLDLDAIFTEIGRDGVHDLWVEAGGYCFTTLLSRDLIQQSLIYIAPKILGEQAKAAFTGPYQELKATYDTQWQQYGDDMVVFRTIGGYVNAI